ncbi:hypothetical protein PanWU01x14_115450 [Parasponia andersonii]|uniref:Uncharacterized protein n=1 Tax=Parasponia andersonii TaxID=3476 RepID=A0A2P5CWW0_PARAD|nr:hypothetical protein PanWU01x14_115450 [Parasponia andersonii]
MRIQIFLLKRNEKLNPRRTKRKSVGSREPSYNSSKASTLELSPSSYLAHDQLETAALVHSPLH